MARKNQRLINYHTSGKTAMPNVSDVHYGEIVVRHNEEAPELLIKVGEESFGVFQASGAVKNAIETAVSAAEGRLNTDISTLEQNLSGHVANFEKFQEDVEDTYATKTELGTAESNITSAYTKMVGAAKTDVYASATTFATNAVSAAEGRLNGDISTLEQNLSGHVADFEKFQDDVEKTYATKTALETAESNITSAYTKMVGDAKDEVYGSATTFATSAVTVAKGELNSAISIVASDLESLSGVVKSVTTDIDDNYVSNSALTEALEQVGSDINSAFTSGKTYTDAQIAEAKKYADSAVTVANGVLGGLIEGVDSRVDVLSGTVNDNKTFVINNYVANTALTATVTTLEGKISDAEKNAKIASSAYTDAQIAEAKKYTDSAVTVATGTLNQAISGLDSKVNTLSGDVYTTIANVQTALTKTINDKVAVAYRYAGSCTYAELPASGSVIGEVWNVTDANGNFPAGTNYAWDGSNWDALGGSIDLSPYAKTEDVNAKIQTINQTNANLQSAIDNLSSATTALVGEVSAATVATYATKTALQTAQENITSAYTKAIGDAKAEVYTSATTFATSAVTAAKDSLNQTIQAVDGRVTDLSGVTKTVKATADSAVQTASADCGVSVEKEGTKLVFSFDELIIDCGDF